MRGAGASREATDGGPAWRRTVVLASGLLGVVAIGAFDYASGTELRVYPLYYGPIGLLAWHAGRLGAVAGALLCAASWLFFNTLAGMLFSSPAIVVANTGLNGVSFLFVGLLIAELRRTLKGAQALSRTDSLTLLRNPRAFFEDSAPLLALCRRTKRPLTVAYLDLDNFKSINDTLGHQAGDALLRAVAGAIRSAVRPSDVCARFGGDEFVVLFPELGADSAAIALERVLDAVRLAAANNSGVTASIGAVTFLAPPSQLDSLIKQADAALYEAKAGGRNRVTRVVVNASELINAG
jgi:diguanylate cyclase (GGDEF)-like protein